MQQSVCPAFTDANLSAHVPPLLFAIIIEVRLEKQNRRNIVQKC